MTQRMLIPKGCALAACILFSWTLWGQPPKKPRMQTSASPTETVYKSWEEMQAELNSKKPATSRKAPAKEGEARPADRRNSPQMAQTTGKQDGKAQKQTGTSHYIAVKTNVPMLAASIQNLAVEFKLHRHISLDLPVMWSIGDLEHEHGLHAIAFQPEGRWWLKEVGRGHFFGLHAHAAWFNLKWNDRRYQSRECPLLGTGLSYGYQLPLGNHWGAEFTLGAGYARMEYDTFYNIDNGALIDTRRRHYWGITRMGASLVYRF